MLGRSRPRLPTIFSALFTRFLTNMTEAVSGLAYIPVKDSDPLVLFSDWIKEVRDHGGLFFQTYSMCLATSTKDGKVGNRNVVLTEFDENGFIFVTDKRGRKTQEINANPWVAATFLWNYKKDGNIVGKQVRIEGSIKEISRSKLQTFYDKEPMHCKIRSAVCPQDKEVDWQTLKNEHDAVLKDVVSGKMKLTMPDHFIGYQIVPEQMDFYYCWNNHIADRVLFTKNQAGWKFVHIAA